MFGKILTAIVLFAALPAVGFAQTYRDFGGTIVQGVAPVNQGAGAGSIATAQASVTTAATQIVAARVGSPGTPGTAGVGRVAATLFNNGSATVYVGGPGVTATTGIPLLAGGSLTLNTTAALYGISAAGTQVIGVVETF